MFTLFVKEVSCDLRVHEETHTHTQRENTQAAQELLSD